MSSASETHRASISGLEFRVLSRELSASLVGTYVSNIYSIGESQLLRMRRAGGGEGEPAEVSLVISPKLGAWVTERPFRGETSPFTTALRSLLLRWKLEGVEQLDLDRVLTLEFAKGEGGRLRLVLEMMPPGNLVLVDPDGKVVLAQREVRAESRRVVKGRPYTPPAQRRASIETLTAGELGRALARESTLGRALGRGLSIPRRYVDELLDRVSRGQGDPAQLGEAEVEGLAAAVRGLLRELEESPYPCLVSTDGGAAEVMVVRPKSRRVLEASRSLSPLLDELFFDALLASEQERSPRGGETGASASERRAMEYRATIDGLEAKKRGLSDLAAELRRVASAAAAAPDGEKALEALEASKAVPPDLIESLGAGPRGKASISSAVFDRAKATEREIVDVATAIEGLQSKLKKESGRLETARVRTVPLARARREWYEKFRWFFTTEGKLAIGGRDAQSNTTLVRRHAQEGDTVYHADLFGSPFFVLKGGREQSEAEVREVAKATVTFSSAWKTGLGAADAYWVNPDQVASAGPSGEYLAHGSFSIKGRKNFVTKNPVEVAVGIDDRGRVVSGPEEAIMKVARGHVTLVPGREKPSETAKKVLHELEPYTGGQAAPGVDDVLRMLPSGGGKVVRRRTDRKAP